MAAVDSTEKSTLDPTTFAVIYNALNAAVQEMSLTFEYSAWSSILSQCRDFSCAIYDAASHFDGEPLWRFPDRDSPGGALLAGDLDEVQPASTYCLFWGKKS